MAAINILRDVAGRQVEQAIPHDDEAAETDMLAGALKHLEEEFGSGYLIYFLMRPYNDALVGVDHHRLAEALLGKHQGLLWLLAFFH